MSKFDEIIHQPIRLKIMAALKGLPPGEQLEFVRLKTMVEATEGNLGAHIATLEKAGYITVEKDFAGKKPRTRAKITTDGRQAFDLYIDFLREIVEGNTSI
jgi:DNA-binding MarR family transcriptional regulator